MAQRLGWGVVGSATTVLARKLTRRAMRKPSGAPRLPAAARRDNSFVVMVGIAAAAGALLALGDVLQQQRKRTTQAA
jgi:hypothetical protein